MKRVAIVYVVFAVLIAVIPGLTGLTSIASSRVANSNLARGDSGVQPQYYLCVCNGAGGGGGGGGGGGSGTQTHDAVEDENFQYYSGGTMNNAAETTINGNTLGNLQSTVVNAGSQYSVKAVNVANGFNFVSWESNSGSLSSTTTNPTTLTTNTVGGGHVTPIVGTTDANWAGYLESGTSIQEAYATFNMPTSSWRTGTTCLISCFETVDYWVGIGGFGSNSLWQAGVSIYYANSNSMTLCAWYEALPAGQVQNCNIPRSQGDLITVGVGFNPNTGQSSWLVSDYNFVNYANWTGSVSYTPDQHTADFVGETPSYGGNLAILPNVGTVTFQDLAMYDPNTVQWNYGIGGPICQISMSNGNGQTWNPSSPSSDLTTFLLGSPSGGGAQSG